MGIAYECPELKKGPIFPAIAMLSKGELELNPFANIPKEFGVKLTGSIKSE